MLYSKNIFSTKISTTPTNSEVIYNNADYGFTFTLPESWRGYSIVKNTWEGNSLTPAATKETGPTLVLRNPKWTSALHYEDIPIMIFTLAQWNSYTGGNFAVSAAPINASELARNNFFVFALPPRWDFDYSQGYEEAENIIKTNPLKAFDIKIQVPISNDKRQCFTYSHEGTASEPYTVNEIIDMTIDGKTIVGTKNGTQKGPDMTNGYSGILVGSKNDNTINVTYLYTVEGSSNKEAEIYRVRDDQTGIEKLRYPLIEKNKMLVPDTTKEYKIQFYARVGCTASN